VRARKSRDAKREPRRFLDAEAFDRKTGAETTFRFGLQAWPEAKQSKLAVMHYRGLAKASWGWAAQRLFPPARRSVMEGASRKEKFSRSRKRGKGNGYENSCHEQAGLHRSRAQRRRIRSDVNGNACRYKHTVWPHRTAAERENQMSATRAQIERLTEANIGAAIRAVTTRHVELFWSRRRRPVNVGTKSVDIYEGITNAQPLYESQLGENPCG